MPNTTNVGLNIPNTGDLPGTWGADAINPDMSSIDGFLGGVVTVSLSSSPVTLSAPAVTITPSAGPYQSQNSVIKLTGVLTANVQVTLPLPGLQRIHNLTTGAFVVTLKAVGAGAVIGLPQGSITQVYNDGTNVYLVMDVKPGQQEFWAGYSALPSWVTACTNRPYLLCDGTVYNYSDYTYLSAILQGNFGGNGITTFAVPDLRGRIPLAYDGTGTRITTAGCGINGQTLGATGGAQNVQLTTSQLPTFTPTGVLPATNVRSGSGQATGPNSSSPATALSASGPATTYDASQFQFLTVPQTSLTMDPIGSGQAHLNVQPAQVSGIWVVKT